MEKIINGKRYNTETAAVIGIWDNGMSLSDFGFLVETLYRKRTGEYFLFGEGGAMTRYAQRTDENSWIAGEEIIPMTEGEALAWAENSFMTPAEIDTEFRIADEDAALVALGKKIRLRREQEGMTQQQLAERLKTDTSIIGKYERAEISMSVMRLIGIANELRTSAADLLSQ